MRKTIFAVDANCLIAAISPWDKRHGDALADMESRLARGEQMSISVQALTETYSVMTRIPEPYRILQQPHGRHWRYIWPREQKSSRSNPMRMLTSCMIWQRRG